MMTRSALLVVSQMVHQSCGLVTVQTLRRGWHLHYLHVAPPFPLFHVPVIALRECDH